MNKKEKSNVDTIVANMGKSLYFKDLLDPRLRGDDWLKRIFAIGPKDTCSSL